MNDLTDDKLLFLIFSKFSDHDFENEIICSWALKEYLHK